MRNPPYARQLIEAQRRGFNVPHLCLSLNWDMGRVYPRVVIPADFELEGVDFSFVRGLPCLIVHHTEAERALNVARVALVHGATLATIFDSKTLQITPTEEVRVSL